MDQGEGCCSNIGLDGEELGGGAEARQGLKGVRRVVTAVAGSESGDRGTKCEKNASSWPSFVWVQLSKIDVGEVWTLLELL